MLRRFQKHLIEMQEDRIANQLSDCLGHFGRKRHRPEEVALIVHWTQLKVFFDLGVRDSIAVSRDIAQQAIPFQARKFSLHRSDFGFVPEIRYSEVSKRSKSLDLLFGKSHSHSFPQ